MATDMQLGCAGGPAERACPEQSDRWQRMWSHREQLLKVARRRSMSPEDAEDAVHEAMLRAAERPELDDERLGAWLTTVTMRLCVDRYRQVNREAEVHTSPTLTAPGPVPVEEAVCDRAEAKWLAVRSGELPARQAQAIWLKSEDLDVGQVAVRMGLSYRTVESLLARARRTLRDSLAGTLGLVVLLCRRGRPGPGGKVHAVAVASTAATLAVAGLVLPYVHAGGPHGGAPRPAVSPTSERWGPDGTPSPDAHDVSVTTVPAGSRTPGSAGGAASGPQTGLSVPEVPLPALPAPDVPAVPAMPKVPKVRVPGTPGVRLPKAPRLPTAGPELPGAPAVAPSAQAVAPSGTPRGLPGAIPSSP
ncbi:sigma-70 family RNA polymerase sigma factor [Streptomyces sp. NPDC002004]